MFPSGFEHEFTGKKRVFSKIGEERMNSPFIRSKSEFKSRFA
jgi:hypothetical protein